MIDNKLNVSYDNLDHCQGGYMEKNNWLRIMVLVLIFGIMLVGKLDAQTDSRLNGTWVESDTELRLQNGNFEVLFDSIPSMRGTYTTNNGELIFQLSHISGSAMNAEMGMSILEDKWYTLNEFIIAFRAFSIEQGIPVGQVNDFVNEMANELFTFIPPSRYSVDTNSLILMYTERGRTITEIWMKR